MEQSVSDNRNSYVDRNGYAIRHVKCGRDMLQRTALGKVPYCEACQCYVTHPKDYERYLKSET